MVYRTLNVLADFIQYLCNYFNFNELLKVLALIQHKTFTQSLPKKLILVNKHFSAGLKFKKAIFVYVQCKE